MLQTYTHERKEDRGSNHRLDSAATRIAAGIPWIIENVPNAPMRADYILCGSQFGLKLVRHRLFEVSWGPVAALRHPCAHDPEAVTVTGHGTPSYVRRSREKAGIVREPYATRSRAAMGIDWMNRDELSQAIPPAYTEFIGRELMARLTARR